MTTLLQHASPQMSIYSSSQRANYRKSKWKSFINTQSSSLKVKNRNDLTRAVAAISCCGLWFRNFRWWSIKCSSYQLLSVTCNNLNMHIAQEFKIGFISVLQKHIYVTRCVYCKWNRFDKSDSYPIWENAWSSHRTYAPVYWFLLRKISMLTWSGIRRDRNLVTASPAAENTRSEGTDVARMHRYTSALKLIPLLQDSHYATQPALV